MGSPEETDRDILAEVDALVDEEHRLRTALQDHRVGSADDRTAERDRLRAVEVSLDQTWDLLRRRRALRENGENPDQAAVRPADQVENYRS